MSSANKQTGIYLWKLNNLLLTIFRFESIGECMRITSMVVALFESVYLSTVKGQSLFPARSVFCKNIKLT